MSEGLNRVTLIGNVGLEPELKYTQGGQAILRIRMATSESFKDRGGERKERTEWHTVIVWGARAEGLSKVVSKGKTLAVEGRIQYRQWDDKDGNKRTSTEIVANNVILLGGGRREGGGGQQDYPAEDSFGDDDIPFVTCTASDLRRLTRERWEVAL